MEGDRVYGRLPLKKIGEFAARSGMSFIKRVMFKVAGGKYDKMAAAKDKRKNIESEQEK